jgi:hypothetical protein
MSIFEIWEQWSLKQWLGWGSKLQSKYDEYRDLRTPDWYIDLTEGIWNKLSNVTKDYLNKWVIETAKTFDEAFAKDFVEKIVSKIKERLGL